MTSISAKITTVEAVETLIQYKFNHSALLLEALQCPSSPNATHPNGNKRLAIIGDTVLQLGLAENWFLGDGTVGDFNQMLQSVASNANLQRVGLELGLERFITVGKNASSATTRTVADTVEAILGAVYLDSGMAEVKDVMDALGLEPREISPERDESEVPREHSPDSEEAEAPREDSSERDESEGLNERIESH